jgi:hypothetical protein
VIEHCSDVTNELIVALGVDALGLLPGKLRHTSPHAQRDVGNHGLHGLGKGQELINHLET